MRHTRGAGWMHTSMASQTCVVMWNSRSHCGYLNVVAHQVAQVVRDAMLASANVHDSPGDAH